MVSRRLGAIYGSGGHVVFEDDFSPVVGSGPAVRVFPVPRFVNVPFSDSNYYREVFPKRQIVLHHTVSDPSNSQADVDYWGTLDARIATPFVLSYDGSFLKLFDTKYWAHHLGVTSNSLRSLGFSDAGSRNVLLNRESIAIEVDSWGGLVLGDGSVKVIGGKSIQTSKGVFYNAYGRPIPSSLDVVKVSFRGFEYFQRYSDAQVDALGGLLSSLMKEYDIPSVGLRDGNFDVRRDALSGVPGIYSHSNFRSDKSDLYPDSRIVDMLKSL